MLSIFIKTTNPEEVLSDLVNEKIEFSKCERCEDGVSFLIPLVYYPLIKKFKHRATITPVGFLGAVLRKKRRVGLLIGGLIGIFLIYLSTFYVWSVTIEGEGDVPQSEILETLEMHGFKAGVLKSRIDVNEIAQSFLADRSEFSFCSINISGAVAHVELHTRIQTRYAEDTLDPYNLISDSDGVIVRMEIENGMSEIAVGDSVYRGQLLVSGIMENSTNTTFRPVRAEGRVWARVNKTLTFEIPLEYTEKKYVGEKSASRLCILGHKIGFRRLPDTGEYDVISSTEIPELFGYEMPFAIERILYAFRVEKTETLTEEEALIKAHDLYRKRLAAEFEKATILSEDFSHKIKNGILTLKCEICAIEEICTRQKIHFE